MQTWFAEKYAEWDLTRPDKKIEFIGRVTVFGFAVVIDEAEQGVIAVITSAGRREELKGCDSR